MDNLKIKTICVGQLQTNCYLIWDSETREALILDPGDDGDFITQNILNLQLKPLSIIFTHAHFDHVLASLELKLNFDIPIFMHQNDLPLLKNAQKSSEYWLKRKLDPIPTETSYLADNNQITIGKNSLTVIHTPGHTPGSITIFSNQNQPILFSGDTLFKNGVGRTDFSYSSPQNLTKSIKKLFQNLPPETICYPGHGDITTLKDEY